MKRRRVQSGRVSSGERRVRTCSAFAFPSSVWTLGHSRAGRGLGPRARPARPASPGPALARGPAAHAAHAPLASRLAQHSRLGFGGSVAVKPTTPERTGSKRGPPLLLADSGPQSPHAASLHAGSREPRAAPSSRAGPGPLSVLKTVGFARVVAVNVYRFRN